MVPIGSYSVYAQVDLSSNVEAATPEKLIRMLYDGALKAILAAQGHIRQHNISKKGESISKALAILGELSGSLNHEVGGEILRNLEALYDYMTRRLIQANVESSLEALEEVEKLLSGLRDAWAELAAHPESLPANLPETSMAGVIAKVV